jgi:lactoylglutathione lyase
MKVLHTAIEVTDLEAMRALYEDLLGLSKSREFQTEDVHNYYVVGECGAEIQFKIVEETTAPGAIDHIAIATDDVDAIVDRAVTEFDSTVIMEPQDLDRVNKRISFITDPEGYSIQLTEQL